MHSVEHLFTAFLVLSGFYRSNEILVPPRNLAYQDDSFRILANPPPGDAPTFENQEMTLISCPHALLYLPCHLHLCNQVMSKNYHRTFRSILPRAIFPVSEILRIGYLEMWDPFPEALG